MPGLKEKLLAQILAFLQGIKATLSMSGFDFFMPVELSWWQKQGTHKIPDLQDSGKSFGKEKRGKKMEQHKITTGTLKIQL